MKKEYLKPEVEYVSFVSKENITSDLVDGSMGLEDSIFPYEE